MITRTRVVSALVAALLLAGPLTPLAGAQQQYQPLGPQQQYQPLAPQDPFQETLRAERESERLRGTYDAGAVAVNVFLVPGRAITCVLGSVVGIVALAATFGTAYRAASAAVHEGCGGKWTVTGEDLRPDNRPRSGMESY